MPYGFAGAEKHVANVPARVIASGSSPIRRQRRRTLGLRAVGTLLALAILALPRMALAFGFEDVSKLAAQRAATPFKPRTDKLPEALARLDYDHFRDIRYKPDRALWRPEGLPFEIAFFHEGQNFKEPVKINEVIGDAPATKLTFRAGEGNIHISEVIW